MQLPITWEDGCNHYVLICITQIITHLISKYQSSYHELYFIQLVIFHIVISNNTMINTLFSVNLCYNHLVRYIMYVQLKSNMVLQKNYSPISFNLPSPVPMLLNQLINLKLPFSNLLLHRSYTLSESLRTKGRIYGSRNRFSSNGDHARRCDR